MTEMNIKDLNELRIFLKWRKESPSEFADFKEDLKSFLKEMNDLMRDVFN